MNKFRFSSTRKKRKYRVRNAKALIVAGVTLVAVIAAVIVLNIQIGRSYESQVLHRGVVIEGVELGGKTPQEALALVQEQEKARLAEINLTLTFEEESWNFDAESLGVTSDAQALIDQAFNQAKEMSWFDHLKMVLGFGQGFSSPVTFSYDEEKVDAIITQVAEKVNVPMQNAKMEFDPNKSGSEMFHVVAEVQGRQIDTEALDTNILSALMSDPQAQLEIPTKTIEPTLLASDLQKTTKLRGRFVTNLGNSSAARTHNVKESLKQFNGMVVNPGQEVSFNDTTGPRTAENGYQDAPLIASDKSLQDGPGGGVCQSSTTIYNAILKAGLNSTVRAHHSFPSSYVDKGFDATVNYGYQDYKFINDTDLPFYIKTYVSGKDVVVEIYGEPLEEGVSISLESELVNTTPKEEPEIVQDTEGKYVTYTDEKKEVVLSRDGYVVKAWRIWKKDGEEIKRELLHTDNYEAIRGKTYVGVKERGADTPATASPSKDGNNDNGDTNPNENGGNGEGSQE